VNIRKSILLVICMKYKQHIKGASQLRIRFVIDFLQMIYRATKIYKAMNYFKKGKALLPSIYKKFAA